MALIIFECFPKSQCCNFLIGLIFAYLKEFNMILLHHLLLLHSLDRFRLRNYFNSTVGAASVVLRGHTTNVMVDDSRQVVGFSANHV